MAGLIPVDDGEVATVVTTLRMTTRPPLRPMPASRLRLVRWRAPTPDRYRLLFRRIGAAWLWYSRLVMDDAALTAIIADERVEIYAVVEGGGIEIGFVELDLRHAGRCEIAYFGLVPELGGQQHGRWLMAETLARAWRPGVTAVWVNTCTLDSPRALGFYRAQGFVAVRRTLESFADPRRTGVLPRDVAPHVPLLGEAS